MKKNIEEHTELKIKQLNNKIDDLQQKIISLEKELSMYKKNGKKLERLETKILSGKM